MRAIPFPLAVVLLTGAAAPAGCIRCGNEDETGDTRGLLERSETGYCEGQGPPGAEEGVMEIPPGSEPDAVTVYGVQPLGGNDYAAVEAILDPSDYDYDAFSGIVVVDCPPTGGDWAWRSFVVSYYAP